MKKPCGIATHRSAGSVVKTHPVGSFASRCSSLAWMVEISIVEVLVNSKPTMLLRTTVATYAVQTPSETVAQLIAVQMGFDSSNLLLGGLTHTTVSARWCPSGRARVMDKWEASGHTTTTRSCTFPNWFGSSSACRSLPLKADANQML